MNKNKSVLKLVKTQDSAIKYLKLNMSNLKPQTPTSSKVNSIKEIRLRKINPTSYFNTSKERSNYSKANTTNNLEKGSNLKQYFSNVYKNREKNDKTSILNNKSLKRPASNLTRLTTSTKQTTDLLLNFTSYLTEATSTSSIKFNSNKNQTKGLTKKKFKIKINEPIIDEKETIQTNHQKHESLSFPDLSKYEYSFF
jgi:hypothetical protein